MTTTNEKPEPTMSILILHRQDGTTERHAFRPECALRWENEPNASPVIRLEVGAPEYVAKLEG